jgi:6-phosphofructokinase 2
MTLALNPAIDIASEVPRIRPTDKVRTENETFEPGGGGVNVARVIHELGGDAEALCLAGGATGALLDELMAEIPLRRKLIRIAGNTRVSLTIVETSTGLEYRFVPDGPEPSSDELAGCLDAIREARFDYFVASGSVPPGAPDDILARVGMIVADKGARFVLDSSGVGLSATLGHAPVYLVKPSLAELEAYLGRRVDEAGAADAAAALVRDAKAEIVAVTLGAAGVIVATRDTLTRIPAPEMEARSAVGAGDSFLAAMTLALAEGRRVGDAAAYGVAAGAAAVLAPRSKVCRREDVARLYEEIRGALALRDSVDSRRSI